MTSFVPYTRYVRDKTDHLRVIETLSKRVAEIPLSDHERPVEACPGWRVHDVIGHLGQVYAMVSAVVVERSTEFRRPGPEGRAPGTDRLSAWFDERRHGVLAALHDVESDTPCWTWATEQRAAFYFRRMAHETTVHWYDLASTLRLDPSVERDSAIDGIDEYFDVMLPFALSRFERNVPAGSLHLHCTDGDGEWYVEGSSEGLRVEREHRKGAVAWRGAAIDLLAAAWGRRASGVDIVGDLEVSTAWSALAP